MTKRANEMDALTKRVRYLLEKSATVTRDDRVSHILSEMRRIGRTALVGGTLRELQIRSARYFKSDLDFVIEVYDNAAYQAFINRYSAKRNKFGGYRISQNNIDIDFWDARSSWAHTEGHRIVDHLEDVLDTTFFNVDAILYLIDERRIIAKAGTFEALRARYLDINLLPNPNPLGATVRALRRMSEHHMRASKRLATFIGKHIDEYGWNKIVQVDETAYASRPLLRRIAGHPKTSSEFMALLRDNEYELQTVEQLTLPLED